MLKLFGHYIWTQVGLNQSWFLIQQQIYMNLWSVDILSNSAKQVSQPDMPVIVHILKEMRNLKGTNVIVLE